MKTATLRVLVEKMDAVIVGIKELGEKLATATATAAPAPAPAALVKEEYTTAEAAEALEELGVSKSPWTLQNDCRTGRINAEQRLVGRKLQWMIHRDELAKILNHRSPSDGSPSTN